MAEQRRILIVGVGSIGERHLRCFAATGRAEVSFCEVNPALRAAIADRYAVRHTYDRFESALDDHPDAVVIATPAHLHTSMMSAVAEAGLPFLVEKPLSTSLDGVDAVMRRVEERKLTAMVAYVWRCHPALGAMRSALASGRFGTPLQIVATCGQDFPFFRPAYRDIYYRAHATGGGAVQDALTHILDAGQWLVGPIDRVVADVGRLALDGVEVEDTAHVLARHAAVMGSYSLNQHQAPNETTITVICDRGTLRFEAHERRWRAMTESSGAWHDQAFPEAERDALFIAQAGAFLDALDGLRAPVCSLAEAVHTLRTHAAIFESIARGEWQAIDAQRQGPRFPDPLRR